jgi:hypothetical protein
MNSSLPRRSARKHEEHATGTWGIYTVVSVIISFLVGLLLMFLWYLFSLIILDYGDSGPQWINTVNDIMLYGGSIAGFIGCKVIYLTKLKKKTAS